MNRTTNKRTLINDVRAKGFSARKATKAVDAVFQIWKEALSCWEDVETPCGILTAAPTKGSNRREFKKVRDIRTKKLKYFMAHYPGRRRVVKLKADPALVADLLPLPPSLLQKLTPPPPAPEPDAEETEARQLASKLLRHPITDQMMEELKNAPGVNPYFEGERVAFKPGALLRRLRDIERRGWSPGHLYGLVHQIASLYWI